MQPYSPYFLKYWFEFNDFQWSLGNHPFVGGMLGNYLQEAGFVDIQVECRSFLFDSREPERRKSFVDYYYKLILSAKDAMISEGRVTPEMIENMDIEIERVKKNRDSVFFDSWMRATARVP
jgi:hypothetical protein